jgi:hypothetical protein
MRGAFYGFTPSYIINFAGPLINELLPIHFWKNTLSAMPLLAPANFLFPINLFYTSSYTQIAFY